jgi:hypothetical protein
MENTRCLLADLLELPVRQPTVYGDGRRMILMIRISEVV